MGRRGARGNVRAPQRLLLLTKGADEPDEHVIEATLTADVDQTILVIEERGTPLGTARRLGAGVQVHVEDLADHLAGRERRDVKARWAQLLPAYQALAASVTHRGGPGREGAAPSVSSGWAAADLHFYRPFWTVSRDEGVVSDGSGHSLDAPATVASAISVDCLSRRFGAMVGGNSPEQSLRDGSGCSGAVFTPASPRRRTHRD